MPQNLRQCQGNYSSSESYLPIFHLGGKSQTEFTFPNPSHAGDDECPLLIRIQLRFE